MLKATSSEHVAMSQALSVKLSAVEAVRADLRNVCRGFSSSPVAGKYLLAISLGTNVVRCIYVPSKDLGKPLTTGGRTGSANNTIHAKFVIFRN